MGKYDAFEIQGPEREKALAAMRDQIAAWGLKMPPVAPLAMQFGLDQFMEIGETEYWVANDAEHGYCGKLIFLFDGQTCPYHHHRMKHETFFIVKGTVRMKVGEEVRLMREGDLLVMPPGVGHSFTGAGPALVLEVSMPSILQDNFFADKRIGQDGVI
jgi:mannose-6-phosphate isomerase-like protein (cupin superfamily)